MALNFPNSPTNGQLYTDSASGNRWVWDSGNTCWVSTSTFTQTITVASSAPGSPVAGQLWWNKDYGRLLVYYTDDNTSQWVDASPSDYTSQLAYNNSNAAFGVANAAFGKANNALANTSGVTFAGNLYVPTYLGIGTNGPSSRLDVQQAASVPTFPVRVLYNSPSVTYANTQIVVQNMNGATGDKALYGAMVQATGGNGYNPVGFGAIQTDYSNRYSAFVVYVSSSDNFSVASHERMRIDNSGNVTKPYQPAVLATRTTHVTSTVSPIIFDNIVNQTGSCYNASTGYFTCPVTGWYFVSFSALLYNMGSASYAYYAKNGGQVGPSTILYGQFTGSYAIQGAAHLLYCNTNDTLSIGFVNNGTYLHSGYIGLSITLMS